MFLSVFTDEIHQDVHEALPVLKSWDLEYVDLRGMINGKPIEKQSTRELEDLKAELDKAGLKVGVIQSSLCKVHLPDKERRKEELEKLEVIIKAADILDCHLVRSFNYWQHEEGDPHWGDLAVRPDELGKVLEMFTPVAKRAREAGLILGFENCGQTADEALALLDALNIPGWGLAFDPDIGFDILPEAKGDATAYFLKCIKRTVLAHVKAQATLAVFDKHRKVPWLRVLKGLYATGKEIPVSIETHNPAGSPYTPLEATKLCVDEIRKAWPTQAPQGIEAALAVEREFKRPYENNPVTFVVVGLGMGKTRVEQLIHTAGVKLAGVCDINPAKAKAVGEAYKVPYSDDINVFLDDPGVEVMYVVTPTGLHCSVAMQCLKKGKHVLTTKPMDVTAAHCDEAIALAKEKGLLLGVDFDVRHEIDYLLQKEAIDKGYFGKILWVNITLLVRRTQDYYNENGKWRGTWKLDGGGSLANQGVHEVDRILTLVGMPSRVRATTAIQQHDIETEDAGVSEWQYDDGKFVRFASTTNYPLSTWYSRVEIHGTEAAYLYTVGGPEGDIAWWVKKGEEWTTTPPYPVEKMWRQGSDNFANSLRTGAPLSICGESGRLSRIILDAIYESARMDGAWVKIKEIGLV